MPKASESKAAEPQPPAGARALLDVNVLIALLDDAHVFARRANEWLDAAPRPIATCPIVENGVIRIMSAPAYSASHRATPEQVARGLRVLTQALDHVFWPDEVSLLDEARVDFSRLHGHRQVTDAYLLALAVRRGGVIASFDTALPVTAVRGAGRQHVLQI
jgi:toxin-antitoxin system PIN domain toxin